MIEDTAKPEICFALMSGSNVGTLLYWEHTLYTKVKKKSRERQNGVSERERKEQRRGYTESNQSSNSQGIIRTSDVARVTEG